MQDVVLRTDFGRAAVLTISRPERLNAYNGQVGGAITRHLERIAVDPAIGACILTGEGTKAFCAGADLKDSTTHSVSAVDTHLGDMLGLNSNCEEPTGAAYFEALLRFPKPLICAVNGYAIGIGFQMQLCCDIIVASRTATFKLPQVTLGIMPAYGGAPRLAQWVGRGKAAEIALSGRFVGAEEAEQIGLVTRTYEPGDLLAGAVELAQSVAENSPLSLALTKESMSNVLEDGASLGSASVGDKYRFMALSQTTVSTTQHAAWRSGK